MMYCNGTLGYYIDVYYMKTTIYGMFLVLTKGLIVGFVAALLPLY
eukprot:SAG31_NODE_12283_length_952_cov_1.430246_1_plen_45_part_00